MNEDEKAQEDAWAQMLARIAEEAAKVQAREETGRGVRRKAAPVYPQVRQAFGIAANVAYVPP